MLDIREEKARIQSNREKLANDSTRSDYSYQLKNRIGATELGNYFLLTESEKKGIAETIRLNVSSTPYYLLLSDPFDPQCPIRRMIVPTESETFISQEEAADPLNEEELSPVPGLTCMYPDRALLFANHECSVYCRHCMRGRKVSDNKERMDRESLSKCFDYLRNNPHITDIVVSGGDPLNLSDSKMDWILGELESIESVQICRIGTRNPVTNPMRITKELCQILEKRNSDQLSIFCNTQFNHPKECTKEANDAILKILKAGVSVGNQCVILKGINDSGIVMLDLHKKLLKMRVRAYYMYDPEILPGSRGFRTPLQKGIEIIEYMRGKISGMGIPHFVNDLPGGGGKITLSPNWYLGYHKETRQHLFRSAVNGTYHLSKEPLDSEYEDSYPKINENLWEELSPSAYHVKSKEIKK